ncbi:MAG: TlpA family protein disulfide reductase [Acidimicrobiales bacterium]
MSQTARSRFGLPWQAYVAATVLALTAAGLVLVFAANRDDEQVTANGEIPERVELRPVDEAPTGDPLDFEFTDVDDTTGALRDLIGTEPLVVNLFASWCPPCIAEMPDVEAVSEALGNDVRFFGLAVTDRPEDSSRIVEETGVTYDWSRDIQGDIAAGFGITTMPSTIFITADGEVAHIQSGALDQDRLRALIAEHLGVPA